MAQSDEGWLLFTRPMLVAKTERDNTIYYHINVDFSYTLVDRSPKLFYPLTPKPHVRLHKFISEIAFKAKRVT